MMEQNEASLERLVDILEQPEKRILPLLYATTTNLNQKQGRQETQKELLQVAQYLFQDIEDTARKYHQISNESKTGGGNQQDGNTALASTLSGLSNLFIPESITTDNDDGDTPMLDAETLWGQVELQNNALNRLLKKSIKRLAKAPEDIVVLDMGQLDSDDNSDDGGSEQSGQRNGTSEDSDDNDTEEEDEEAKRIRLRMERTMKEMESDQDGSETDDDNSEEDETDDVRQNEQGDEEEDAYDPIAEEMKDGFFDLHEMEAFADEEEDYLPDEAYGQPEPKKAVTNKEKKSFHQKQRDGDLLERSDDEEDEDDMYEGDVEPVRRKKYRDAEDIDALFKLYKSGEGGEDSDGDDSDDEDDVINMTAADFFGQPAKEYMERYKAKKAKEEIKDDNDSWGEYDFENDSEGDERDDPQVSKSSRNGDASENDQQDEEEDDEDSEGHEDDKPQALTSKKATDKSFYAKQQEKLQKQTEELEKELLAEKPWKMIGEAKATSRPVNSLLESTPEFEMASKQAPTITVEHTANLEEIIKKRIIAEDWDDVVPRELPDVAWHKKRGELPEVSQEKSKLGLGELYEREYLKKALGYDKDAAEKETEEDKAKDEMKRLFANLCSKLDALSNYHFAPRPIAEEAEVRPATAPAIAMEEVLPLHVSDARGVAPEEVYATKRGRDGVLRGENEMDQQERKRLRQSKKAARRKARKEKLADDKLISRLEPGLGLNNPYEKRKAREELSMARSKGKITTGEQDTGSKYGSSGTFFKRLQAEAQQSIRGNSEDGQQGKEKKSKPKSSSFML